MNITRTPHTSTNTMTTIEKKQGMGSAIGPLTKRSDRRTVSAHLRAVAVGLLVAIGAVAVAPGLSQSASAAGANDGHISSSTGAAASVFQGCSQTTAAISIENRGFSHVRVWSYDSSAGAGSWSGWNRIGNTTYTFYVNKSGSGSIAMYWQFWDGSRTHGEWVPFSSGYAGQNTGYWCGVNGAF